MKKNRQPRITQPLEVEAPDWSRWLRYVWLDNDVRIIETPEKMLGLFDKDNEKQQEAI